MMNQAALPNRVLLVDDSRAVTQFLAAEIRESVGTEVDIAGTLAEADRLLQANAGDYLVNVLDLNLPDAPNGEVVDLALSHGQSVIVLTGHLDEQSRNQLVKKPIIDYVFKSNASEFSYVAALVHRVQRNREHTVLVTDDSRAFRLYLRGLLEIHGFQVVEAADGREALERLREHPEIVMVLTDYHMPNMNGQELTTSARQTRSRNELAIIALSDRGSSLVSAQFLKCGANDFITKPFLIEEFNCRIAQNIETIEHIRTIRESMRRDHLTQVFNRGYLFEMGATFFENAQRGNLSLSVAMLDIDFFKRVNDTYGHPIGDRTLQRVAAAISSDLRQADVIGRYGGEEFALLLVNANGQQLEATLERIRRHVEALEIPLDEGAFSVTISIGATQTLGERFESMIEVADGALYEAKESGRNRVVIR